VATETLNWRAARAFIDRVRVRECCTAPTDAPAWMHEQAAAPYLCRGLPSEPEEGSPFRVLVSGWTDIEGVMVLAPENDFPADLRAGLAALSERALRDLLLSFPAGATGLFYYSAPLALAILAEVLDGHAREGYYATPESPIAMGPRSVRRLGPEDHGALDAHWSPVLACRAPRRGPPGFRGDPSGGRTFLSVGSSAAAGDRDRQRERGFEPRSHGGVR